MAGSDEVVIGVRTEGTARAAANVYVDLRYARSAAGQNFAEAIANGCRVSTASMRSRRNRRGTSAEALVR